MVAFDGAANDYFGQSVAIYNCTVVVGALSRSSGNTGFIVNHRELIDSKYFIFICNSLCVCDF